MPEISVIVPIYKVENYLVKCIDSILAQSFTDFELILVDDGSPDRCGELCDNYAQRDKRIHVIHKQNGGLSDARNAGLDWIFQNSDSRFISFVDSDDTVHPRFLDYMITAATEYGADISMCDFQTVTSCDLEFEEIPYCARRVDAMELYTDKDKGHLAISACNKLYAKDLWKGFRYPKGRLYEDAFLTHKLLYEAKVAAVVAGPLYRYIERSGSITHSQYTVKNLQEIEAFREQCAFFQTRHEQAYITAVGFLMSKLSKYIGLSKVCEGLKPFRKSLRVELRRLVTENRKKCGITFYYRYDLYQAAFPVVSAVCFPYVKLRKCAGAILRRIKALA